MNANRYDRLEQEGVAVEQRAAPFLFFHQIMYFNIFYLFDLIVDGTFEIT